MKPTRRPKKVGLRTAPAASGTPGRASKTRVFHPGGELGAEPRRDDRGDPAAPERGRPAQPNSRGSPPRGSVPHRRKQGVSHRRSAPSRGSGAGKGESRGGAAGGGL